MQNTLLYSQRPLPKLTKHGVLPSGIHLASLEEVRNRFGNANAGRVQLMSIIDSIYNAAQNAGLNRIVLTGSFITNKPMLRDLDGILFGPQNAQWDMLKPFCYPHGKFSGIRTDFFIASDPATYRHFTDFFQQDRNGKKHGIVEIPVVSQNNFYIGADPFVVDWIIENQIAKIKDILGKTTSAKQKTPLKKLLYQKDNEKSLYGTADFIKQCLTAEVPRPGKTGQGDVQLNFLIGLLAQAEPRRIIDVGCGKGRLITELCTLDKKTLRNLEYIGIDFNTKEAMQTASDLKLFEKCRKVEFSPFSGTKQYSNSADFVFLINVLHEIPLDKLASNLLKYINFVKTGGFFIIHDMGKLPHGEKAFIPWQGNDIKKVLSCNNFKQRLRVNVSRSGVPLYTLSIKIVEPHNHRLSSLNQRIIAVQNKSIEDLLAERESASKRNNGQFDYAYNSVAIANTVEQLRMIDKKRASTRRMAYI